MHGHHFLVLNNIGNARGVSSEHRDLLACQLAGNATHLLADVIVTIARFKCLQLLFEIGALLASQTWGA